MITIWKGSRGFMPATDVSLKIRMLHRCSCQAFVGQLKTDGFFVLAL